MRINPWGNRRQRNTRQQEGRHRSADAGNAEGTAPTPDPTDADAAVVVEQIHAACVDGVQCAQLISEQRGRVAGLIGQAGAEFTRLRLRLGRWVRGVWAYWVAHWPALAYVTIAAHTVVGWPGWAWIAGRSRQVCRAVGTGVRVAGRGVWRWLRHVLASVARLVVRGGRWVWRRAEPWVRDACGWLVHTAPRRFASWCGRMLARFLRWVFPALARLLALAAIGLWWLLRRLVRYVLAYPEFAPLVRELEEDGHKARRVKAARDAWRRTFYRRATGLAVFAVVVGIAVHQVISRSGLRGTVALIIVVVAVLAGVGRAIRTRPPGQPKAPEQERGVDEPYPIADAHTRTEAADCVARAVRAEGVELRRAGDARREPWGWTVPVILKRGTPAAVVAKLGELETTLDLPSGGVLAAPDPTRRAQVVLRLAERDPFAGLRPVPAHLPASLSIRDSHTVGTRMDGTDLSVCFLGVHAVVIGTPGAGKSMTLRTLADVVSACRDAVVWDLDPSGNGLDALGGGVGRWERGPRGIDDALAEALALAEVRPRMFGELGMGDAWQPTPQRPAVAVFVDEYPRLTDKAKRLAVDLLRVGRKARITVILAASEATSDTLGAAIADTTALKILMPCRHTDVRLVLGPNMTAEGWRPDRLNPATGESPEDAGCCYVYGLGARDPIVSKIRPVPAEQAREQGVHRAAQGLPRIDIESLTAARARRARDSGPESAPRGDRQAGRDVLAVFAGEPKLWTEEILSGLSTLDARYAGWTGEDLAAALRPFGVTPVQVWRHGRNRNGYERAAIAAALDAS